MGLSENSVPQWPNGFEHEYQQHLIGCLNGNAGFQSKLFEHRIVPGMEEIKVVNRSGSISYSHVALHNQGLRFP